MVYCFCNRPASHYVTKKLNDNNGRWFYTCETNACQFFVWDDKTPREPQQPTLRYSFSGAVGTKPIHGCPLVKCRCDEPARHLVTKKLNQNHGRWFYNCSSNICGYFLWDDETPRQPIAPASDLEQPADTTNSNTKNTKLSVQFYVHSRYQIAMTWYGNNSNNQKVVNLMKRFATFENYLWVIPTTKKAYRKAIRVLTTAAAGIQQPKPPPSSLLPTTSTSNDPLFDIHPLPNNVAYVLAGNNNDNTEDHQFEKYDDDNNEDDNKEEEFNECLDVVQDLPLWKELKPSQRDGVKNGIRWKGRMLLGDEMGFGKTVQAIAISYAYLDEWPVLVVCPSSIRTMWKNELLRWTDLQESEIGIITQGVQMAYLPKNKKRIDKEASTITFSSSPSSSHHNAKSNNRIKFWITSYDLATKRIDHIVDANFKIIIADESHLIKNRTAKRTQVIVPVLKKARRVLLLTGTPALARPIELFSQVSALRPDIFKSRREFGERYCGGMAATDNWGREYMGAHRLEELHFLLTRTVLLRRLKDTVGDQLPSKIRQAVLMDVAVSKKKRKSMNATGVSKQETQQSQGTLLPTTIQKDTISSTDRRNNMIQWYSDTARAKVPVVQEYLDHIFEEDSKSKIIVFAYHHVMLNAIEKCVAKKKTPYIRIDGTTNHSMRQALCDEYQSPNSKTKIAILSLAVAFGFTLSAADLVLFAELYWSPAHLLQAEDRAHRIGRVGPVNVIYILAMDTIDGVLWPLLKRKLQVVGAAIDGSAARVTIDEEFSSAPAWAAEEDYVLLENLVNDEENNK